MKMATKYLNSTVTMTKHKRADVADFPPLLTLLSLGLSNGGRVSSVTITIRPL